MAKDLQQGDWEKDAPFLSSLKREQPYEAPEGYFDSFPDRMMALIKGDGMSPEPGDSDQAGESGEAGPALSTSRIDQKAGADSDSGKGLKGSGGASRGIRRILLVGIPVAAVISVLIIIGLSKKPESADTQTTYSQNAAPEDVFNELELPGEEAILEAIDLDEINEDDLIQMMGEEALAALEFTQGINEESILEHLETAPGGELNIHDLDVEGLDLEGIDLESLLEN